MKNPTIDSKKPFLKNWRTIIAGYIMTTGVAGFNLITAEGFDFHDPHAWLNVALLLGGPIIKHFYSKK